jgi:hypothetical protein
MIKIETKIKALGDQAADYFNKGASNYNPSTGGGKGMCPITNPFHYYKKFDRFN